MKLAFPFSEDTRNRFLYDYACENCHRSDRGLELHHICGRTSNSCLNAILLCLDCHKVCGHSQEEEAKYLQMAIRRELRRGYQLTEDDVEFYRQHKHLYDMDCLL